MSYTFYKILHLISLFFALFSIGGLWLFYSDKLQEKSSAFKKFLLNLHGISFFVAFVAGFGLIAKLQIPTPWPLWIYIKLLVWLFLGASPFLFKKGITEPQKSRKAWFLFVLLLAVIVFSVMTAVLKYGA